MLQIFILMKEELKDLENKTLKNMACIYKITNLINNKIYIGLTKYTNLERFKEHIKAMNQKGNENYYLYNTFRKYNIENFKSEVIIEGNYNIKLLSELEKHYIRLHNSNDRNIGYNLTNGGDGISGYKHTKAKLKIINLGRKQPKSFGKLISKLHKGKITSQEVKEKMSKSALGRINSKKMKKDIYLTIIKKVNPNRTGRIIQMDKLENILNIWDLSTVDLAKQLNIKRSSLSTNLCGKSKTCNNFIFKYETI